MHITWSKKEIKLLKSSYDKEPLQSLMKKLNKTKNSIYHKVSRLGISNLSHLRTYKRNDSYFSTPNLENCYWAGFIAADGNIRQNNQTFAIALAKKDRQHLEQFKKNIQYTGPISYYAKT
ncbi:hypothetical protein G4A66_28110, partial [Escherichia coli]|uniref:hypothetical protein n=1 Tax=Escherichia coli TaxID=562 RepID=UPI001824B35C